MDKIYVYAIYTHEKSCINDAEDCGDTLGYAMIVDGANYSIIENHYSSGINWTKHDMGITSDWKHEIYKEKFPNGYELIWLGGFENHEEAKKATEM